MKLKIIQILFAPNNADWQGVLLGLCENGKTYRLDRKNGWVEYIDQVTIEHTPRK